MSLSDSLPLKGSFCVSIPSALLSFKKEETLVGPSEGSGEAADGSGGNASRDIEAPECYCEVKFGNAAGVFERMAGLTEGEEPSSADPSQSPGDEQEAEAKDPSITVKSKTCKGEAVECEDGCTFRYSFDVQVTTSKFEVVSESISSALVNDVGEVNIFRVGEGGNGEDKRVGGGKFSLVGGLSGAVSEIVLGEVPEPSAAQEGEEGAKQADPTAEVEGEGEGEEKKETENNEGSSPDEQSDNSPGPLQHYGSTSSFKVDIRPDDIISDYSESGSTIFLSDVKISADAGVFGVTVEVDDETDNAEYLRKLQEKLDEENNKWIYECVLEGVGGGRGLVLSGGAVKLQSDENADGAAEEASGEPPAPAEDTGAASDSVEDPAADVAQTARPSVGYYLAFQNLGTPKFLSYNEGKAMKNEIRSGNDEFVVKYTKKSNPNAAPEEVKEEAPKKGGKKGKQAKKEEVPVEPDAAEAENGNVGEFEGSFRVSLSELVGAGVVSCEVKACTPPDDGNMELVGKVKISRALFSGPTRVEERADGESLIKSISGPAYVVYQHSLNRNMFKEFQDQLDTCVDTLVEEYAELFLLNESATKHLDKKGKLKKMLYHLNKNGGYASLKESLKPCIQRIVTTKVEDSDIFTGAGAPCLDTDEGNVYVTKLFDYLVKELNQSIVRKFVPQCVLECRESRENDIKVAKNIPEKMVKLKMLAEDYEGVGDFGSAKRFHLDRIGMAEVETREEKIGWKYLVLGQVDFANFLLNSGAKGEAIEALKKAVGLNQKNAENVTLLSAVLLEESKEGAGELLQGCFRLTLPTSDTGEAPDEDDYAAVENAAILNVLAAIGHSQGGDDNSMLVRKALRTAAAAVRNSGNGYPQRHLIVACLSTADYLLEYKLVRSAATCLAWADECEARAKEIARENGLNDGGVRELRARMAVTRSRLHLCRGDLAAAKTSIVEAEKRFRGASDVERGEVAFLGGEIDYELGDEDSAMGKFCRCLELMVKPIPFKIYHCLYEMLSRKGRWKEAREVMFRAAKSWKYSSVWLKIAKASIEIGYLEDAEDSLQESNGANTNDGRSWGLFVVVCLRGGGRVPEANEGLKQALGLGLSDLEILKEMGTLFTAIDEHVQAEAIWRRGIKVGGGLSFGLSLSKCLEAQREYNLAYQNYDEVLKSEGGGAGEELKSMVEAEREKLARHMGMDIL